MEKFENGIPSVSTLEELEAAIHSPDPPSIIALSNTISTAGQLHLRSGKPLTLIIANNGNRHFDIGGEFALDENVTLDGRGIGGGVTAAGNIRINGTIKNVDGSSASAVATTGGGVYINNSGRIVDINGRAIQSAGNVIINGTISGSGVGILAKQNINIHAPVNTDVYAHMTVNFGGNGSVGGSVTAQGHVNVNQHVVSGSVVAGHVNGGGMVGGGVAIVDDATIELGAGGLILAQGDVNINASGRIDGGSSAVIVNPDEDDYEGDHDGDYDGDYIEEENESDSDDADYGNDEDDSNDVSDSGIIGDDNSYGDADGGGNDNQDNADFDNSNTEEENSNSFPEAGPPAVIEPPPTPSITPPAESELSPSSSLAEIDQMAAPQPPEQETGQETEQEYVILQDLPVPLAGLDNIDDTIIGDTIIGDLGVPLLSSEAPAVPETLVAESMVNPVTGMPQMGLSGLFAVAIVGFAVSAAVLAKRVRHVSK